MTRGHLSETELARVSGLKNREELEGHLRWCSHCRRALADYSWLEGEMEALLEAEADAVSVPQANWQGVWARLGRAERRNKGKEMLVAAGAALVICLMFGTPAVLGRRAEAQAVRALGVVTAPAPILVGEPATTTSPRPATGGVSASGQLQDKARISLPLVPVPTPPTPHG